MITPRRDFRNKLIQLMNISNKIEKTTKRSFILSKEMAQYTDYMRKTLTKFSDPFIKHKYKVYQKLHQREEKNEEERLGK